MVEKIIVFLNEPHVLDFFHVKCDGNKVVDHLANVGKTKKLGMWRASCYTLVSMIGVINLLFW